jgi:hypothetical protein
MKHTARLLVSGSFQIDSRFKLYLLEVCVKRTEICNDSVIFSVDTEDGNRGFR